jgi:hypothetical protein
LGQFLASKIQRVFNLKNKITKKNYNHLDFYLHTWGKKLHRLIHFHI